MTVTRSATYWGAFRRSADLQAINVKTGEKVWKTGRGTHMMEMAYKSIEAGVWKDVQVKAFNAKAWIPFADVAYTPAKVAIHGRRRKA